MKRLFALLLALAMIVDSSLIKVSAATDETTASNSTRKSTTVSYYKKYGEYNIYVGEKLVVDVELPANDNTLGPTASVDYVYGCSIYSVETFEGTPVNKTDGSWPATIDFFRPSGNKNAGRVTAIFDEPGTYRIFVKYLYSHDYGTTTLKGTREWRYLEVTVNPVPVTEITVTPNAIELELEVDKEYKLAVEVKPQNATYPDVIFYTNQVNIVDVDKNGNIIPLAVGKAVVTVESEYYEGVLAKCVVNVVEHTHAYSETSVPPTCTDSGVKTFTCTCGNSYTETVLAIGHDLVQVEGQPATCTEAGCGAYEYCSVCDYTTYTEIAATGHAYGEVTYTGDGKDSYVATRKCVCGDTQTATAQITSVETKSATCLEDGEMTFTATFAEKWAEGKVIYENIPNQGHNYTSVITAPTCTDKGYTTYICSICSDSYTDHETAPNGHTWDDGIVTKEPTDFEEGEMVYTCTSCGTAQTITLPKLNHIHSYSEIVTAPSCVERGYTTYTCACGDSYIEDYIDAVGHECNDWKNHGTIGFELCFSSECMKNGGSRHCLNKVTEYGQCVRCGSEVTREVDGPGHSLTFYPGKPATCTEDGWNAYEVCSLCDHNTFEETRSIGHLFDDCRPVVTPPTCTEKGFSTAYCHCGESYVMEEVPALGHEEVIDVAVAATCTETGLTEGKHCSVCNEILAAQTVIPAYGHTWDNGKVTKEPTEEATGTKLFTCERCGETREETLPKLDHVHAYTSVVTAPTCTEKGYTTHTCSCGDSYVDIYVDALDHKLGKWEVAKEATCTEDGSKRRDCERCDHYETEFIKAPGHKHESVVTAPTCTEQGYTTHSCSCGDSYVDSYVDAMGHDMGEWIITSEATCTEAGFKRSDCSRCDYFETESIGSIGHKHEAVVTAPTCTEKGYTTHTCSCGDSYVDTYVDALGHDMGEWIITSEATCTEAGFKRSDCSRCDYFETESIGSIGHKHEAVVTAPTCTEKGYTTHTCHCGDSYVDTYVEALDHKWDVGVITKEPTEDTTGTKLFTCERCGETKEETVPKLDHVHSYISIVTDPSCTEKGYTTHTCSCSDSYVDIYVDALGHDMGEWIVIEEATCTEDGEKRSNCSRCDHFETEVIEATGHNYEVEVTEPTCTEQGYTTHTCHCGDSYVDTYVDALDHKWDVGVVTKEPTEEATGTKMFTCERCEETKEVTLPKLDHTHKYESVVTAPTCTEQGYTTHTCSCGDSYVDSYVDALGHEWGVWTEVSDSNYKRECAVCGESQTMTLDEDKPVNTTDKEDNAANADLKNDSIELIEKVLTEEEQNKAAEGTEVKVYLKTEDISDNVSTEISAEVKTKAGDSEIGMYLDINLFKQIGSAEEIPVRETSSAVTVTITVPEYLINTDGTVTRTYKIIRVHADENGGLTTSVLAGIFNSEDNSLSFETDKFSTYALVYEDVQAEEPLPEANIQVARMILGNELAMQFAFPKADIVEGVNYVVSVTKTYADGRADKNILVPQSEWKTSGSYYYVSFNGIAAKEMGDTINVQILTADGVTVGDVYTDSVQNYATRQLQKTTDAKTRTLYVDMLNYGAAAQDYFGYDAEDLVTDELTETEKGYGTQSVKLENNLVKGPGYGASQLNLASSIQLRVKFNGIDSSMYAIVKFTNHMGREIEARVEGSEFMYSGTVVVIDQVVAADYDRDVTITVYDANGNAVASAVESVASYIARMTGGAEIYSAVAKYCAAAYGYLHK